MALVERRQESGHSYSAETRGSHTLSPCLPRIIHPEKSKDYSLVSKIIELNTNEALMDSWRRVKIIFAALTF